MRMLNSEQPISILAMNLKSIYLKIITTNGIKHKNFVKIAFNIIKGCKRFVLLQYSLLFLKFFMFECILL